jgi:hypothetical protein
MRFRTGDPARSEISSQHWTLRSELQGIDQEVGRLTEAIATGGQLAPLLDALKIREARRREVVTATLNAQLAYDRQRFDRKTIEAQVRQHLTGWRGLLTNDADGRACGRQLWREVLGGSITFTPQGRTYRFSGEAAIGPVLAGTTGLATFVARPEGLEPPAYRFEACRSIQLSYGRVRASVRV